MRHGEPARWRAADAGQAYQACGAAILVARHSGREATFNSIKRREQAVARAAAASPSPATLFARGHVQEDSPRYYLPDRSAGHMPACCTRCYPFAATCTAIALPPHLHCASHLPLRAAALRSKAGDAFLSLLCHSRPSLRITSPAPCARHRTAPRTPAARLRTRHTTSLPARTSSYHRAARALFYPLASPSNPRPAPQKHHLFLPTPPATPHHCLPSPAHHPQGPDDVGSGRGQGEPFLCALGCGVVGRGGR